MAYTHYIFMAEAFTQSEAENNPSMKALNELIIPARKSFHQFIRNKSQIVVGIKKGLKSRLKQKVFLCCAMQLIFWSWKTGTGTGTSTKCSSCIAFHTCSTQTGIITWTAGTFGAGHWKYHLINWLSEQPIEGTGIIQALLPCWS